MEVQPDLPIVVRALILQDSKCDTHSLVRWLMLDPVSIVLFRLNLLYSAQILSRLIALRRDARFPLSEIWDKTPRPAYQRSHNNGDSLQLLHMLAIPRLVSRHLCSSLEIIPRHLDLIHKNTDCPAWRSDVTD